MGLYGSGKTTTAAKLAKFYQDRGLSAALVCCDVTRPAAYTQLETLAKQANVAFFGMEAEKSAAKIIRLGMEKFRDKQVVICDTSGRNALDDQLIKELKEVADQFKPDEKVLVVSADLGQVAGKQAREFDKAVKISGVILTKMDGSGKGGGALSASSAANARVMFIGMGEKLNNIEPFDSNKFIGSLLGIPDIASLIEHVQTAVKEANLKPEEMEAEELNFETFYSQLKAMGSMGSSQKHIWDDGRAGRAQGDAGAGRGEAEEVQGDNRIDDKGGAQERKAAPRPEAHRKDSERQRHIGEGRAIHDIRVQQDEEAVRQHKERQGLQEALHEPLIAGAERLRQQKYIFIEGKSGCGYKNKRKRER